MTEPTPNPTVEQIAEALPRVPAGICSGDLTEADERIAFAERLHAIYTRALT